MNPLKPTMNRPIILLFFLFTFALSFPFKSHGIIIESPQITDRGVWGDVVNCSTNPSKFAIGFQLRMDYRDPFNEDNTALNGIWLACGNPHRNNISEDDLQSHQVEWISSTSATYGQFQRRLFCGSDGGNYIVGFRLKSQQDQGPLVDDVGAVNLKMICSDGEEIEGYEEKDNLYPDVEYTESVKCPRGTGVCGIQTQVEDIQWEGDNTALNNLRIKCCNVPEHDASRTMEDTIDEDDAVAIEPGPLDGSLQQLVKFFENQEGFGLNESFAITYGQCNRIPDKWVGRVGSLEYKADCVRIWSNSDCSGYTRCHCDDGFMSLDQSLPMSKNVSSWQGNINGLTMCMVENGNFSSFRMFSEKSFQGESEYRVLVPGECLTLYEGEKWRKNLGSMIVVDGCLEYFDGEECSGNLLNRTIAYDIDATADLRSWKRQIMSLKNCANELM